MEGSIWATILLLLVVLLLALINGYFVACEFSLVSVRKTRIDQLVSEGNARARVVRKALDNTDDFIAATQLGITMASLLLGRIGEPALAHLLEPALRTLGLGETGATWGVHGVAFGIAFTIITALHIVLGELAPKTIALQASESTALWVTGPLQVFLFIFRPFINLMNGLGRLVVRALGFEPADEAKLIHSEEEISMLVQASARGGALEPHEQELIQRAFAFDRVTAGSAMLPRTEVVAIPSSATLSEILRVATEAGYTRYPVYEETVDNVVGVVNVKTLVGLVSDLVDGKAVVGHFSILDHCQPPLLLPETAHADDVLQQMTEHHTQMGIVIDEYGGTAGIVTREGLLDRLVGGLSEDPEGDDPDVEMLGPDEALVNGLMPIPELEERFNLQVEADGYNTVGGLVFGLLGSAAQVGSTTDLDGYKVIIEEMDGLRIARLRLIRRHAERA